MEPAEQNRFQRRYFSIPIPQVVEAPRQTPLRRSAASSFVDRIAFLHARPKPHLVLQEPIGLSQDDHQPLLWASQNRSRAEAPLSRRPTGSAPGESTETYRLH